MKRRDACTWLCAPLGLWGAVALPGCAVPQGDRAVMASATDGVWRAEVLTLGGPSGPRAVLRAWRPGQGTPVLENSAVLPPSMGQMQSQSQPQSQSPWRLTGLTLSAGRLAVALQYRPMQGSDSFQDKRFEFDLNAPQQPLVHYRAATTRGDKVDWQTVDFVQRTSAACRGALVSDPTRCQTWSTPLTDEPVPTFLSLGNAEDYVPPVKVDVQR
jgi:hypothetical protein